MPVVDLTSRALPYSLYIPSMQRGSAANICMGANEWPQSPLPAGLLPEDFNYLRSTNRFWTYRFALASAESFGGKRQNAVTNRDTSSFVLGDSGGFQIGKGTFGEARKWKGYTEQQVVAAWRQSPLREKVTRWSEANCSYAMTLDIPLWTRRAQHQGTPFNQCSATTLQQLTVENLQYLERARGRWSDGKKVCKYLNVLQGDKPSEEDAWYQAVKSFKFDGWSFAGGVGANGGPYRVLRRLLIMRDDKLLGPGFDWLHILMLTAFPWAPIMTAIQRGLRRDNESLTVSYDSSTPYMMGGRFEKYFEARPFTSDYSTWSNADHKFPTTYGYASCPPNTPLASITCSGTKCASCTQGTPHLPVPLTSPIAKILTMTDLVTNTANFARRRVSRLFEETLINHNVYTLVDATIRANEAVFGATPNAPQEIVDAVGTIGDIFSDLNWHSLLDRKRADLEKAVRFTAGKDVL